MKSMFWITLTILLVTLGCSREPDVVKPPPLEVVVSQPVKDKVEDTDVYTGNLDPRESVQVHSRVRGHIKFVKFTEGEEIDAGTELFVIDSEPFQADLMKAKGQLVKWEANLKLAEEKIAFYKPLADKGTVSREELLKVVSDKGEALGGIATTKGAILDAELNIGYCNITAPIAGKVGEALVTKGNLVNSSGADSLLTTIVGVDPMYVYFYVNERKYNEYRKVFLEQATKNPNFVKGKKLKIPVDMAIGDDPVFRHKGEVDFVDNRVDPTTGSLKVRAKFDNRKAADDRRPLTVGLFARVRVSIVEPYEAMLVTDRAILSDQARKYVLVVNKEKNNQVERVDITQSERVQENGLRAIEGLKGSEWVIVDGINRARPGATVAPKEEKMPRRPVPGK